MESGPDGAPVFAGEISVDDTPTGSTVYVDTGGALDVPVAQRVVASHTTGSGDSKHVQRQP